MASRTLMSEDLSTWRCQAAVSAATVSLQLLAAPARLHCTSRAHLLAPCLSAQPRPEEVVWKNMGMRMWERTGALMLRGWPHRCAQTWCSLGTWS